MSSAWQARFAAATRGLLREPAVETARGAVPNPVHYFQLRRSGGRAPWSACLVEHATGRELPERLAHATPLRMLRDMFADTAHLRNDIFSYPRETGAEGELNNGVLMLQHFLDLSVQQAANRINDLSTVRLLDFERFATGELFRW